MLRTAGFPLITCPSVALAQLVMTGTLPPVAALIGVALVSALIGHLTSRPGARAAGALQLTAQLAVAQLLGHAVVYLALGEPSQGCLPAMGRGAALGLRLAVLRDDGSCASGYATGSAAAAAAAVLLIAAAVLLWQLLVAAGGSLLLRAAERTWTAMLALVAFAALVLRRAFQPLVLPRPARRTPDSAPRPLPRRAAAGAVSRRGPPAVAAS